MSSADEGAAGDLREPRRWGGSAPAGPGQDRHDAGPRGCPGRAAPVRSARRRRQRHRRHPAGARRSRVAAEVDKELAALKTEIGPGSSVPPKLAGSW